MSQRQQTSAYVSIRLSRLLRLNILDCLPLNRFSPGWLCPSSTHDGRTLLSTPQPEASWASTNPSRSARSCIWSCPTMKSHALWNPLDQILFHRMLDFVFNCIISINISNFIQASQGLRYLSCKIRCLIWETWCMSSSSDKRFPFNSTFAFF